MTHRADFSPDEWELVVQTPRWVVAAASAAQHDVGYRTNHEIEQGFVATAHGRDTGNAFVTEVAAETLKVFDNRAVVGSTPQNAEQRPPAARTAELAGNILQRHHGLGRHRAPRDARAAPARSAGTAGGPSMPARR